MEDIIYDVKNILKKPETIHRLDDLTAEFKKNKFIKYLPSEDRAELKNRILFDENALIDVIENNSLHFIPSECLFRKKILGYDL